MNIVPLFSSPLGWNQLTIPNQPIEDFCYKALSESTAKFKNMGWQSGFLDVETPELKDLVDEVKSNLKYVSELYAIKPEHELKLTNMWININRPGGMGLQNNVMHLHPGKFVSFVYYVKVSPGCGNLHLLSPLEASVGYAIPDQIYGQLNMFNSLRWIIAPEVGKLAMFPSWVQHFADPNNSNEDRISIAFNAELQNTELILKPKISS